MIAVEYKDLKKLDLGKLLTIADTVDGSLNIFENGRVLATPHGLMYEKNPSPTGEPVVEQPIQEPATVVSGAGELDERPPSRWMSSRRVNGEFAPPPGQPRDWHGKWLAKGGVGGAPGPIEADRGTPTPNMAMEDAAKLYNVDAEYLTAGQGHYDQERAAKVYHAIGFDGPPTVVSPEELNAAIAASPHGELWRVVTTPAMAEQYRSGPMFVGQGYSGTGTYAMHGTRDEFDQFKHGTEFEQVENPGELHMALAPDAAVMTSSESDLQDYRDAHQQYGLICHDPGATAAAEGYDAIRIVGPHPDYFLILNRTKVIVSS